MYTTAGNDEGVTRMRGGWETGNIIMKYKKHHKTAPEGIYD